MIKLSELCLATDGGALSPYDDFIIKSVSTDSRNIKKGDVFFALRGENFDGHDFCDLAVKNGASAIVIDKISLPLPENAVVIKVEDTLKAYQEAATYWRLKFDIPVIAVTGSTGKTTTKDIIAAALSTSMKVLKSYGNFNNEIGVPATLLQLDQSYQAVVLEMGMRGLGQIRELAEIAKPTVGVVTNVGKTHIELLGSVENIAKAKQELVETLAENSIAVLNCSDANVGAMAEVAKGKCVFFGSCQDAHFQARDIRLEENGISFLCLDKINDDSYEVFLSIPGRHNVDNALSAVAVATMLGVDKEKMLEGLKAVQLSAMRQQIEKEFDMTFIDDSYNASPDSMKAALELLKGLSGKRKIAVLGDMLELGEISSEEHAKLGSLAHEAGVNLLITIGSKSYNTSVKAGEFGVRTWHFATQRLAAKAIVQLLAAGDTVLFKGSRGMHLDELLRNVRTCLADNQKTAGGNN